MAVAWANLSGSSGSEDGVASGGAWADLSGDEPIAGDAWADLSADEPMSSEEEDAEPVVVP